MANLKTLKQQAKDFVKQHPVDSIEDRYIAELMYFIIKDKPIRLKRRKEGIIEHIETSNTIWDATVQNIIIGNTHGHSTKERG